ncbi:MULTISPECIES: hypothetical protein [Prochlorococcus]|uniref:hypothetical protein n=1 Tax=Prochlorococcus TaxID=1218 RepID=UPI0005339B1F|nr:MULTISPECIES: hypothetical protein [Prochlorococcus]KGG12707.1 hypothetical protein EV05_1925 [Prochlorococcus sp. MIT 0601]
MKKFFLGPLLLGFISLICPESINADIRSNCFKEWGDDYSMVEFCIEEQTKARNNVYRSPGNNIKNNCLNEWGDDYSMVEFCIEEQSGALKRLQGY